MAVDEVALTGLIIALVALVIAFTQLLQQIFATAEGYRNCQAQVMGPWAGRETTKAPKLTKRRPVWSQFRLQTRFIVPYITMDTCNHGKNIYCITGSNESRAVTHCPDLYQGKWPGLNRAGDMVAWIFFLDQLHRLGSAYPEWQLSRIPHNPGLKQIYGPCLVPLERTWDFMSPDVIKPLAGV
jgi:hypothetical protein